MSHNPPSYTEDLAFVQRLVAGDEESAREFSRKYLARFVFLARRNHIPPQDCDDVAQEALVKALRQLKKGQYRGESSLGTWLGHIIRGTIAEYFRNLKKAFPVKTDQEGNPVEIDSMPINDRSHHKEDVISVHEVLPRLTSMHRIMLILIRHWGWTIHEVGQRLGMTDGQVSHKLYAAQEEFRHHLEAIQAERRKARKKLPPAKEGGEGGGDE